MFFAVLFVNIIYSQQDAKLEFSPYSDTIQVNHLHKNIGELLFKYVKEHIDFIQYDDLNNCDLRSHLICTVLEKKFYNLKTGKVWLFADSKLASKKNLYKDKNYSNLSQKTGSFTWGYHVAPFVIIEHDTLVIDPTTQSSITPIRKWANDLIPFDSKAYLIVKNSRYFCYPSDEEDKFMDNSLIWVDKTDGTDATDEFTELAEKIAIAYSGVLDPSKIVYYKNKIIELCGE